MGVEIVFDMNTGAETGKRMVAAVALRMGLTQCCDDKWRGSLLPKVLMRAGD